MTVYRLTMVYRQSEQSNSYFGLKKLPRVWKNTIYKPFYATAMVFLCNFDVHCLRDHAIGTSYLTYMDTRLERQMALSILQKKYLDLLSQTYTRIKLRFRSQNSFLIQPRYGVSYIQLGGTCQGSKSKPSLNHSNTRRQACTFQSLHDSTNHLILAETRLN